ncbi:MAG: AMP-binding protein [Clostridiales bacterium]|nr:AMP-binding protein [Clostridiales bacterium]
MIVDDWIAQKIGLTPGEPLTRRALEAWQLAKLNETLLRVTTGSAFYRERLEGVTGKAGITAAGTDGFAGGPKAGAQGPSPFVPGRLLTQILQTLPFTTPEDLVRGGASLVCVPASRVDRIVTLPTSGTTGAPKRVWFTNADQELMTDYIHHGLPVMVRPGDVFLVLMPCERPGSVGDLVAIGVERIGARALRVGAIPSAGDCDREVLGLMAREGVTTGLATAPTAARLARRCAHSPEGEAIRRNMRTILLSAQYISDKDKDDIEGIWDCLAYEHYGMTEMGLGGAMACEVREGYHPREADLLFEIIDPDTGAVLPDGEYGEIVFTTLTREAMPLIRYRTGDHSRFLPEPCPCGSVLKRLDKVGDRHERKNY